MRYTKAERAEEGGKKKNRYWMWVEEGMNKGENVLLIYLGESLKI